MKKRKIAKAITSGFLAVIMMASPVLAADNIRLRVNGIAIYSAVDPMLVDGYTLVSLREFSNMLGARYVWDITTKTAIITKGNTRIKVTADKQIAVINDVDQSMSAPAILYNDVLMAPVRFIGEALGAKVSWEEASSSIVVDTGLSGRTILDVGYLESPDAVKITYSYAVSRANEMNSSLSKLENSIAELQETYEVTKDNLSITMGLGTSMDSMISTTRSLKELQTTISNVYQDEKILKESTEYTLRSHITNIEKNKMDIKLTEESLSLSETNIKNLELKNSLGMTSDLDLKSAKLSFEQNKTQLSQAKTGLQNIQQGLSRFLEYDMKNDVVVDFKPEIKPLNIRINEYTVNKISEAPTIKKLEEAVASAEYAVDTNNLELKNADLDQIKTINAYQDAQRNLSDAKRDMEKNIHATYNQLQQLRDSASSLTLELEKAKDTYNKTAVNYQAGNVTLYDVDRARLAILDAEVALEKNKYDYDLLMFAFERPYLLSGK